MSGKARENTLKCDEIKGVLEFVTSDEAEADKIVELLPTEWLRTIEKSNHAVTITLTGSFLEVQERSISFFDILKEAGLPSSLKNSSARIEKGQGDDDEDDDEGYNELK